MTAVMRASIAWVRHVFCVHLVLGEDLCGIHVTGEVIIARHVPLLLYSIISFNANDRKRTISLIDFITVRRFAFKRWQTKGVRVPGCLRRTLNNQLRTEKV